MKNELATKFYENSIKMTEYGVELCLHKSFPCSSFHPTQSYRSKTVLNFFHILKIFNISECGGRGCHGARINYYQMKSCKTRLHWPLFTFLYTLDVLN